MREKESREGERTKGSGSSGARISTGAVQLFRKYTGRGPSKAHTTVNDEVVFVVLRETLTTGERTLIAAGEEEQVLSVRRAYQQAMRRELTELVEEEVGRSVAGVVSFDSVDPEVSCEVFVLDGSKPAPD